MLDHVTIGVRDMERSVGFYDRVLGAIGMERRGGDGVAIAGYCAGRGCFFWIGMKTVDITGVHVAFGVPDRALVDRFHAAGLAAGGRDNGKPGLRTEYHPDYYGAFILDPDGHNIEAVCRQPG